MKDNEIRTCFISPHSDDIVMSSFQIIRKKILSKHQTLLTIFGVSEYVDISKREIYKTKDDVTMTRLKEDKRFAKEVGINFDYFKIPDCLLRHRRVFFNETQLNIDKKLFDDLVRRLTKYIIKSKLNQVVVHYPSGNKRHFDHRLIVKVAQKIPNIELLYVDDIPYSRISSDAGLELYKSIKLCADDLKSKHNAMDLYSSQMCSLFHNQVDKITRLNNMTERIFKNEKGDDCHPNV